jgi:glycosyltransferase involved in cell wall biosynthesis
MTYRILTQINFSAGENPEGDSGLYFIRDLIHGILDNDTNFHFYVLTPKKHQALWEAELHYPRVTLIPIDIAQRSHGGDFQFSPDQILETINFRKYEVDCLFLNQPELVIPYVHLLNKLLFHNVPAVSYVHWFDIRKVKSKRDIQKPALLSALAGMLISDLTGCNSIYGRQKIIAEAGNWFNDTCIEELQNKIRVVPPGLNTKEIDLNKGIPNSGNITRILINHRLLRYTGVRELLAETFPKLWELRQDFVVIVTNPSKVRLPLKIKNVPWLINGNYTRQEYLKLLWECDIVVSPHKATNWSISTLEAMYSGCIPLLNINSFFPELVNPIIEDCKTSIKEHFLEKWFFTKNNLILKLIYLLDNLEEEKEYAREMHNPIKIHYDWSVISKCWIQIFYDIGTKAKSIASTNPSFSKICNMVERKGSISKEEILRELAWGPQSRTLSWSAFRKSLNALFTEDSLSPEVTYSIPRR